MPLRKAAARAFVGVALVGVALAAVACRGRPAGPPSAPGPGGATMLPEIDLRHVLVMTDDTGMLQHARYATPDPRHGYCTDDNARALIAAVYATHLGDEELREKLRVPLRRYLAFLHYGFDDETGRFRNFMGYDRRWLEKQGSPHSHGRAVWALGVAVRWSQTESVRDHAAELFVKALPQLERFRYPRPLAFGLLGLDAYLQARADDERAGRSRELLAERLYERWRKSGALAALESGGDWPWPEDILTYANAKLPHALIVSGAALGRKDMVEAGLASLRWLLEVQTAEAQDSTTETRRARRTATEAAKGPLDKGHKGHISIIGNKGWYVRGGTRARFDQQPLDAHALVHACLDAADVTGNEGWDAEARRCFAWFTGRNDVGVPLYDPETGGCRDGLLPAGVNKNEGAESTLAYVLSVLEFHVHARRRKP